MAGSRGSSADAEHIIGELMKSFKKSRKISDDYAGKLVNIDYDMGKMLAYNLQDALPAIALSGHHALSTAWINDGEPLLTFAQQVNGYDNPGDVFLGISTSGNSMNVLYAAVTAKAKGLKVIGLSGANHGKLSKIADVSVEVPATETYMIQEYHLPIYHCWCLMLEEYFFPNS